MAFSALEALQAFGAGRQLAQQDRQMRTRAQASQQAAAGDFEGAASTALGGGEFDLAGHLRQLSTQHQQQALQEAQILAGGATDLRRIPDMAQRQAAWLARRPQIEHLGIFAPHELDKVDLSNEGLDGYIRLGTSAMNALHPQRPQAPTNMQRNADFISERYGPEASDQYMTRQTAPPPITQHNADGTITIIPQATAPLHRRDAQQPVTLTPDQLRQQAAEAIAAGRDPAAVNARLQQMLGGSQPQQTAPAFGGGAPLTVEDRHNQYPVRPGAIPQGNPLDPNMGQH